VSGIRSGVGVWIGAHQSRFHRVWFVVGTVVLAVSASRVANDTTEIGSWLLTVGSVLMIAASDAGRDFDERARRLAAASGAGISYEEALNDLVRSEAPRWLAAVLPVVAALVVAAVIAYTVDFSALTDEDPKKPSDTPTSESPSHTPSS
jgi:hypothetical protein